MEICHRSKAGFSFVIVPMPGGVPVGTLAMAGPGRSMRLCWRCHPWPQIPAPSTGSTTNFRKNQTPGARGSTLEIVGGTSERTLLGHGRESRPNGAHQTSSITNWRSNPRLPFSRHGQAIEPEREFPTTASSPLPSPPVEESRRSSHRLPTSMNNAFRTRSYRNFRFLEYIERPAPFLFAELTGGSSYCAHRATGRLPIIT